MENVAISFNSCPFCGSSDLLYEDDAPQNYISCNGCKMNFNWCDSAEEAAKIWNKRSKLMQKNIERFTACDTAEDNYYKVFNELDKIVEPLPLYPQPKEGETFIYGEMRKISRKVLAELPDKIVALCGMHDHMYVASGNSLWCGKIEDDEFKQVYFVVDKES